MNDNRKRLFLRDHLLGLVLAVAYLTVLLTTAKAVGYSRDEGFYFSAARQYQPWFDILLDDTNKAADKDVINRHWKYNNEHPALMKILFGFSNRFFYKNSDILSPATSFRLPGMLAGALCIYLLYLWGSMAFGRRAGFFAAVAFALMPRVFYHAHLACFDMAITSMWLLVCYLYWRSLFSWKFGIATGLVFGLALCVKLNAFFLPFVLAFHYMALLAHRRLTSVGRPKSPVPRPWAFVFGLLLAPPIFLGHWPWLWHDTWQRLQSYMGFHSTHPYYNTAWFGENIIEAPTPIALPLVMTLLTIPTVIIVLGASGSLIRLRHHFPAKLERLVQGFWAPGEEVALNGLDFLLFLSAVFPIALISAPSVPIFGGTKHWMPAFPFLALLAGIGASRISDLASLALNRLPAKAVQLFTIAFLLVPPLQQTATSHPFGLESYVPLIGGARGAATLGMTRQFWGYTTAGVLPWLNENVPPNGRVNFHDTAYPSVLMFREEGTLRNDIQPSRLNRSQVALMHHELHMVRNEAWIWNGYRTFIPSHVLTYQGVPIVSVYERTPINKPSASRSVGK